MNAMARGPKALTQRELDCLRLTADGHTADEIARILGLSPFTVTAHITNAKAKIGGRTRSGLIATAFRMGLIR